MNKAALNEAETRAELIDPSLHKPIDNTLKDEEIV